MEKKLYSISRQHVSDETDYPQRNSDYFVSYKKLFIDKIKNNKIEVIYTINPVNKSNIYDYINKNCFDEKKITEKLVSYELIKCEEIDN